MATPRQLFESRTAEYESTLTEIASLGGTLEDFKDEYVKLWQALEKSFESDSRLVEKTQELQKEIESQQEKYEKAKKEEEELGYNKDLRAQEIKRIWDEVGTAQETEVTARTHLEEVKASIDVVKAQIDKGSGWSEGQEKQLLNLRKQREEIDNTLNLRITNLQTLRQDVQIFTETVGETELKKLQLEQEVEDLNEKIKSVQRKCNRANARKLQADKELKEKKNAVESYQALLVEKNAALETGKKEIAQLEQRLKNARKKMENYLKEYDSLFHQTHHLTDELEDQARVNTFVQSELKTKEEEIEKITKEISFIRKDIARVNKLKDHTLKKIISTEKKEEKVKAKRTAIKEETKILETECATEKKEYDTLMKQIDELKREREILNKGLVQADDRTRQTADVIAMYNNTQRNLENEIHAYKQDALRDRKSIEQLEEDVKHYEKEAAEANQRYLTAIEEVKLQETQISELQFKIVDAETKLKQQQNLYEAVRSDRNLYSKNLIESQDEIYEMKRKFKIMNHQIEQLKDEITIKDHALVKEHFDHHKVEMDKETLKNELTKIKKQIQSSEQIASNQETEIKKLSQIISDAKEEWSKQKKEYEAVVSERDLLGSQLIRRNEELASLYEKIKIQKSSLNQGEGQYAARKRLIQELEKKLEQLDIEYKEAVDKTKNIGEMQREIIKLDRELMQERSKVKALSEELETPLNVHRWRKLEGSDPQRYGMLRRIQTLQKEIIDKTESVVQIDIKIQEKEKLYLELKTVLARQPGPEVAEQLAAYQQNLKDKQKHTKAMKSELKMYQAQVYDLKFEIDSINETMKRLHQQYFQEMKKRRQQEEEEGESDSEESSNDDEGNDLFALDDDEEDRVDVYSSDEEKSPSPIRDPDIKIPTSVPAHSE